MDTLLSYDKYIDLILGIDYDWIKQNTKYNEKIKLEVFKLRFLEKYNNILKEKIELWMFVPCDDNGNYMEEPVKVGYLSSEGINYEAQQKKIDAYNKAKEKCYFTGFDYYRTDNGNYFVKNPFLKLWWYEFDYQVLGNFNYLYRYSITQTLFNKIFSL